MIAIGPRHLHTPIVLLATALAVAGCDQQMENQRKIEIYERGQLAVQPPTAPNVDRHQPMPDQSRPPASRALLTLGQQRFDIFCAPCHGVLGNGRGIIVERGFPAPPSFHLPRLRNAGDRHIHDVISHGFGIMYSYGDRLPPNQRWAVVAYIRALQSSQNFPVAGLPEPWPLALGKSSTQDSTP